MRRLLVVMFALSSCMGEVSDSDGGLAGVDGGKDAGALPDAGEPDAGGADAGEVDAGEADAGEADAGGVDAGNSDAGVVADAGEVDGGGADAGTSDAGSIDGGVSDAGRADAGVTDGGVDAGGSDAGSDGGVPDAGLVGDLLVTPRPLSFGSTPVGSPLIRTITFLNQGTARLTVSQLALTGPFAMQGLLAPFNLLPGASVSASIVFTPVNAGAATGTLTVTSDALNPTVTVALDGVGLGALVYPPPTGEPPSPLFDVQVIDGRGTPQPSFVAYSPARQVTTAGWHGTDAQAGRSFSWTTFETDVPVVVRVTKRQGTFTQARVRPTRYGITPTTVNASTIQFTISPNQKVSVEFDSTQAPCSYAMSTCVRDILTVFADRREAQSPIASVPAADVHRPAPGSYATNATVMGMTAPLVSTMGNAMGKRVVVFGPGVYSIGYWQVPPNVEQIHLEGGAIVYGALEILPLGAPPAADDYLNAWSLPHRPRFKLTGHGILSGQRVPWHVTTDLQYCVDDACGWWKMIRLVRYAAFDMTIEDVTLAGTPYWTVTAASIADDRVAVHMRNFKVLGAWAFNNDGVHLTPGGDVRDCFVQANDDAVNFEGSDAGMSNCVMWSFENGGTFQSGWYPKTISNIAVRDIDVIHQEGWWGGGDTSGIFDFYPASGPGRISAIDFTNLNVEGPLLRLTTLSPQGGQRIDTVTFTNVNVEAWGNDIFNSNRFNVLNGTDGGVIADFTFTNLRVGGVTVTNAAQGRFQLNGNVSNVRFLP